MMRAATALAKRLLEELGISVRRFRPATEEVFMALCKAKTLNTIAPDNMKRAFLYCCLDRFNESRSQNFQDIFVLFVVGKHDGVFCEFGATDGISLSNSFFLESALGWSGVLAEPARR